MREGDTRSPNLLALELLRRASELDSAVVIVRDKEGALEVIWTEQDWSAASEAALFLSATVQRELWLEHNGTDDDGDE